MTSYAPTITLDEARTIIAATLEHGRAEQMNPLVVLVLDAASSPIAYERSDGSPTGRFDIARGKANGALQLGVNSKRIGEMAIERPHFINGVMASISGPFVPVAGGVIVLRDGVVVGAVGVSGDTSDNDEAAAIAGITAAGLDHP
ncbi:MAG: heme-binding protein [Actinomycetota bacterium]|jgi:uncharacterized protein GlcG (DUF336 family)|nr:heme-binding protein [Actinomycetota bacterium]MDA3015233.1 heme-binding protein [Actinomycetota bacterium]MDA3027230.1 heme-binding protein [Actinomycetota bacterium]